MGKKIARKVRQGAAKTGLQGEAKAVLDEALSRMDPQPTPATWKKMARGLAVQRRLEKYFDAFTKEQGESLSWEWGALWICHAVLCEVGLMEPTSQMYRVLTENFPSDYATELSRGRLLRDHEGDYFGAREHFKEAMELWPKGYEAPFHLGILYDLMGVPEYAFVAAEQAFQNAEQVGEGVAKLKAQISFNQAVAMWQAARPYGDIKAYLYRAMEFQADYERAKKFLESLPDDDEADPKGRSAMQRFSEDMRRSAYQPSASYVEAGEEPAKA